MLHLPTRRSALRRLTGGWLVLVALAGAARAADSRPVQLPGFAYPEALPAVLAAAKRAGVAVDTRERPPGDRTVLAGDAVTFLVSLRKGDDLQQWVLAAETAELTEKEAALPPLKGFHAFASTGTELTFGGRRAAIEMTLIGPVTPPVAGNTGAAPDVKRRRLVVNADYLELGFDAACEAALALRAENAGRVAAARFEPKIGSKPFSPEVAKANRELAAEVGFTPERERAFYGSVPALLEFIKLVVKTPGLQDILKNVVEASWWSVLSSGGKAKPRVHFVSPRIEKLAMDGKSNLQQYVFPFVLLLNEKPAMSCLLIVTGPRAPFGTTAGVIGMQVGRPYDNDPQLTVRLIATRIASTAPAPGEENRTK